MTAFIQRRVVIVAGHIRLIRFAVGVRAIHPAKTGPSVEHIQAHRISLPQHPIQILGLLIRRVGRMRRAPVIEPAVPIFPGHHGSIRSQLLQLGKIFLCVSGSKIDYRRQFRQGTVWNLIRAIRCIQLRLGKPRVDQHVVDVFHIRVVLAIGAILVLHLHRDDGPTVANLQRRQLLAKLHQPRLGCRQKLRVSRSHHHVRIFQQPRRKAAEVPLRTGIWTRPQDDIQSLLCASRTNSATSRLPEKS